MKACPLRLVLCRNAKCKLAAKERVEVKKFSSSQVSLDHAHHRKYLDLCAFLYDQALELAHVVLVKIHYKHNILIVLVELCLLPQLTGWRLAKICNGLLENFLIS